MNTTQLASEQRLINRACKKFANEEKERSSQKVKGFKWIFRLERIGLVD
jgi:hypothetical protein